jgi:hypothetical protein
VGEGHHIHLIDADARLFQAEGDGPVREGLRVLLAVESLLFHERHWFAVLEQRGGGVVREAVDPEDVHACIGVRNGSGGGPP